MRRPLIAAAFVLGFGLPAAAHAAPGCSGDAPKFKQGAKFAGEVRQIIDGQTICVGRAANPQTWIKVRLSDLNGVTNPSGWNARRALRRLGLGKYAVCTVSHRPDSNRPAAPVAAVCRVAGVSLAGRMKYELGAR